MLNSITIKNFKAIGENELTLNNLANVNYLVGKNGCGKSSVLECIEYFVESGKLKDLPLDSRNFKIDFKLVGTFSKAELGYKPILHPLLRISESEVFLIRTIEYFNNVLSDQNFQSDLNNLLQNFDTEARRGSRIPSQLNGSFQIRLNQSCIIKTLKIKCNEIPKIDFKKNALTQLERGGLLKILKDIGGFKIEADVPFIYGDNNVLILKDQENTAIPIETLSDGQKVVIKFFFLLKNDPSINTILIDEPETGLHPQVQKMLPKLFAQFPEVQFFVATHSPFIISAAAKFQDSQKVYLIEGGKCLNSEGSSSYEAKMEANKLLGAGLEDFHKKIVICEGDSKKQRPIDEIVYNTIFSKERYLFISAGGETEIAANSILSKRVLKSIFKNTNSIVFYLKDGDNKSKNIQKNESENSLTNFGYPTKFINRYAIEMYIYDPEVVKLAFPGINHLEYKTLYNNWIVKTSKKKDGDANQHVFDHGLELRQFLNRQLSDRKFAQLLANKINLIDTREIYKELHDCIFLC